MANSNNRALIDRTRIAAKKLGVAGIWAQSKLPVNIAEDFIYEMYVLFRLINDLSKHYMIRYDYGSSKHQDAFPRKSAKKEGRPKFEIFDKTNLKLQICAGTKIKDIVGKFRSPDISFQKGSASDKPTYKDIELIWDAKYRKKVGDKITEKDFSSFSRWLELLQLRNQIKPGIKMNDLKELKGNCLVTNGKRSTENDEERRRSDIKEVENFAPNEIFNVRP